MTQLMLIHVLTTTGDGQNNGSSCEKYTLIFNTELGHHLSVKQLVSFLE
jgi:hypothetical protein